METNSTQLKCKSCGAVLPIAKAGEVVICEYCRTPNVIDDGTIKVDITNHYVDEVRLKELEIERLREENYRLEMQSAEEKSAEWKKLLLMYFGIVAILFILACLFNSFAVAEIFKTLAAVVFLFGGAAMYLIRPNGRFANNDMRFQQNRYQQPSQPGAYTQNNMYQNGYSPISDKDKLVALALCVFIGWLGGHYFYVRRYVMGGIYFLTLGRFGIGWIVDIIRILLGRFRDCDHRVLV